MKSGCKISDKNDKNLIKNICKHSFKTLIFFFLLIKKKENNVKYLNILKILML